MSMMWICHLALVHCVRILQEMGVELKVHVEDPLILFPEKMSQTYQRTVEILSQLGHYPYFFIINQLIIELFLVNPRI